MRLNYVIDVLRVNISLKYLLDALPMKQMTTFGSTEVVSNQFCDE